MVSLREFHESRVEIEKLLSEENLGFLGMSMNNIPYTIPITYGYHNGKIIFHCTRTGRKLDYLRSNPKVCLAVGRHFGNIVPHPQGAVCHAHSNSVICNGIARIVDDIDERCSVLNIFNRCIQPNAREITRDEVANCTAVEIMIIEMTARIERDSQCTYWKYSFSEHKEQIIE